MRWEFPLEIGRGFEGNRSGLVSCHSGFRGIGKNSTSPISCVSPAPAHYVLLAFRWAPPHSPSHESGQVGIVYPAVCRSRFGSSRSPWRFRQIWGRRDDRLSGWAMTRFGLRKFRGQTESCSLISSTAAVLPPSSRVDKSSLLNRDVVESLSYLRRPKKRYNDAIPPGSLEAPFADSGAAFGMSWARISRR
jgi:hypothetical protein